MKPGRTTGKLHPDETLLLVLRDLPGPAVEAVPLAEAAGRVLARPVAASFDQPPFDKASMDGYALGAEDPAAPGIFKVADLLPAGAVPKRPLPPGECARIMTGAPVPPGTVRVHRFEFAETLPPGEKAGGTGEARIRCARPEPSSNVIRRGENLRAGAVLLTPRVLLPQDVGLLAAAGLAFVEAAKRPSVGIVSTGGEIAPPGRPLAPGEIYDSNGPMLAAQTSAAGGEARFFGILPDDGAAAAGVLAEAFAKSDVLVISGAVSAGDFDIIPSVLGGLGVETVLHGHRLKPGKPLLYGRLGDKAVFGLPGNPVSAFVCFELFVVPHLRARCGLAFEPRMLTARLAEPVVREETDRLEYLPGRTEPASDGGLLVRPVPYRGSFMLAALAEADCLLRLEIGEKRLEERRSVRVRLLRP